MTENTETAVDALTLNDSADFVDPWNVESQSDTGIDYDKLISELINKSWNKSKPLFANL